ncbi:glycosyltransferase [Paracoccus cavernae]
MTDNRPHLTLFSAAPVVVVDEGHLRIDDKFVAGMDMHARHWDGPITAVVCAGKASDLPFSSVYPIDELGFRVKVLPEGAAPETALEKGPGLVLASADMTEQLALGDAAKALGLSVVYGIEYTLDTRMRIAMIDKRRGYLRRLWSVVWNYRQERRRKQVLRQADGIQMNGFPAASEYSALNSYALRYLDNRMQKPMFATTRDMVARQRHHEAAGPLRLIHSGRLEPLKGAHLLLPLAELLVARGVPFTLAIYGDGSLAEGMRAQIAQKGLGKHVSLHGPLPFESGLVPVSRMEADLFISCHVQSDPSCTYLEAMGCGLPVLGFDNQMLSPLVLHSNGGWTVPMNQLRQMAEQIGALAKDRKQLLDHAEAALTYARRHDAESEFEARMAHLARVFKQTDRSDLTFAATPSALDLAKS